MLVAINPFLIYFSGDLSETLFISMLAWSMVLLTGRHAAVGAALLALSGGSANRRSPCRRSSDSPQPRAQAGGGCRWFALIGVLTFVIAAAVGDSQSGLDERIWTTTNSGITAYDGFSPSADRSSNQVRYGVAGSCATSANRSLASSCRLASKYARENRAGRSLTGLSQDCAWAVPLSDQFGSAAFMCSRQRIAFRSTCW